MQVLFVPSIGLDISLLERLANSVDFYVKHKVAFNNGPAGALDDFGDRHRDWIIKESQVRNMGVAGSWNLCPHMFPEESAWMLMNEDAYFLPGYLEQICKCADKNPKAPMIFLNESNAYYCFVWTAEGLEKFGMFDENLWPAYMEDYDMRIRHRLGGVTSWTMALQGLPPLPHGKPQVGGPRYNAMIQGTSLIGLEYFYTKWGTLELEKPVYNVPYGDSRLPLKEWVWNPEHRAKLIPIWESFMALPNPSIYT